jgi:dolichol-phosphate mannosyltransferase
MSLTVILPTLNERQNVVPIIKDIFFQFHKFTNLEILVVDDNSTDGTRECVQELAMTDYRVKLLTRNIPDGLTGAIKYGISNSNMEFICWMDSDGSMPAKDLLNLWKNREQGADIILGSRFISGGGFKGVTGESRNLLKIYKNLKKSNDSILAVILSRVLNYFLRFLLGFKVKDYTSGFILLKKKDIFIEDLKGYYGEYCPVFLYKCLKRGLKILEIPYINIPREYGTSKTGTNLISLIRTGIPYVKSAIEIRFRK